MPKDEVESEQQQQMKAFAEKVGGKYEPTKKGIRKTRFGWVTREEFKEKIEQQHKDWKSNLLNRFTHDDSGTKDAPTVDATAED